MKAYSIDLRKKIVESVRRASPNLRPPVGSESTVRRSDATSSNSTRRAQAWSRHFYEKIEIYGEVDGLVYLNAHNDEEAIALHERASDTLECPPERVMRLDDQTLRTAVLEAADDNNLAVDDV